MLQHLTTGYSNVPLEPPRRLKPERQTGNSEFVCLSKATVTTSVLTVRQILPISTASARVNGRCTRWDVIEEFLSDWPGFDAESASASFGGHACLRTRFPLMIKLPFLPIMVIRKEYPSFRREQDNAWFI